jgi:hypothetical protein
MLFGYLDVLVGIDKRAEVYAKLLMFIDATEPSTGLTGTSET